MNNEKFNIKCKKIVGGITSGKLLVSEQPINFLAMIDIKTGKIMDKNHKLNNQTLKNSILIFPNAIGSSVGAYTIFSLKNNNTSPNGIICTNSVDITTASGCAISNIPLVFIEKKENEYLNKNRNGNMDIILDADNGFIILNTTNDKSI
jgi:predicted aconitase with swiveling domain